MRRLASPLALLLAVVAACDNGVGDDSTRLTVLLTDDPGDFKAAVVTISQIYLQGSSDDDSENGRVILLDEPVTTDLLTLVNDVEALVEDANVAAGTYGQLRFVIDGAWIEVETATGTEVYATPGYAEAPAQVDGQLICPSCAQSGLKVNFQGALSLEAETETILVDFDVAESFGRQAGASGNWVMHPVLHAASVEAASTVHITLALSGGIALPEVAGQLITLAGFSAVLRSVDAEEDSPGEVVAFLDADNDGTFAASYTNVLPGTYTITLRGPAGIFFSTTPVIPRTITVGSGVMLTEAFTITAASPTS